MMACRFTALYCKYPIQGDTWQQYLHTWQQKYIKVPIATGPPYDPDPYADIPYLIDLTLVDPTNKKIILVEFKDTDLHQSVIIDRGKRIRTEFGRMIATATKYKLKGYLVECYCLYIQPKLEPKPEHTAFERIDVYLHRLEDWITHTQAIQIGFLNDERTLMSICADFGIKPKAYGNKQNAAEFPFKRITERWGLDLSIPLKCSDESPLLAKMLVQIDGVSPEKASLLSMSFKHNLFYFMELIHDAAHCGDKRFEFILKSIWEDNKDGTPSAQYSRLYQLFFNDEQ